MRVDGRGFTRAVFITVFDNVAYGGRSAAVFDPDRVLQSFMARGGNSVITDAAGNVLFQGPNHFYFVIVDGEPVDFIQRGPSGPCVPGID